MAVVERALTTLIRRARLPRTHGRLLTRAEVPLEPALYSALVRVDDDGPLRLTELAENLGVDVSTVSRQVAALQRQGLVARTQDTTDRRAAHLATTAEGRKVVKRLRQARREALAEVFSTWSGVDVARFASLLDQFVEEIALLTEPE